MEQLLLIALIPSSCAALPPTSSTGYYWIQPSIGSPPMQVYCDFNRQCGCGGSSPWTRVAFLNMSDPNEVCLSNWRTYTSPVRACGTGESADFFNQCDSVIYPNTMGQTYSRVCGRVIAYQHRNTYAFYTLITQGHTLEQQYLDGVSITHGSAGSRQHVWSFASTVGNILEPRNPQWSCSCSSSNNWPYATSFVGNDYFCDTGNHASEYFDGTFLDDCGMVLGVVPPAPAAHSTTLHGSARPSSSPPLMTWRSGSVSICFYRHTYPAYENLRVVVYSVYINFHLMRRVTAATLLLIFCVCQH